jgi:hypothetical protein
MWFAFLKVLVLGLGRVECRVHSFTPWQQWNRWLPCPAILLFIGRSPGSNRRCCQSSHLTLFIWECVPFLISRFLLFPFFLKKVQRLLCTPRLSSRPTQSCQHLTSVSSKEKEITNRTRHQISTPWLLFYFSQKANQAAAGGGATRGGK